jgi:hypothetical protein
MIVHIIWFFVGAVCGILGAGYFFAVIRDREREALNEFLQDHPEVKK